MKEYDVKITETLEKTVTVEAESRDAAEEQVKAAYYNSEYILDVVSQNKVPVSCTKTANCYISSIMMSLCTCL